VVRYEPNARFPAHDHPEGEEIVVLEGVFSDEHGDWPAGTFLANPEGFRHAPFSDPGCLLFVKLRQFPGRERRHVAVDTDALPWQPGEAPGVRFKPLYAQEGFADETRLERWEPGVGLGPFAQSGRRGALRAPRWLHRRGRPTREGRLDAPPRWRGAPPSDGRGLHALRQARRAPAAALGRA
jgi:hypothetical protein